MIKTLLAVTLAATSLGIHAQSRVTYVGDGRNLCNGSTANCAQIENNNRQREAQRQYESQRDQDLTQAYVNRERRKVDERQYQQNPNR
jgi:hypothetical protein